jgi:cytochrome c oxidase subunit 3
MFAALFFGYALYRVGAHGTWPPAEFEMVPLWLPLLNTGVIVASSVALERGRSRLGRGDVSGYGRLLAQCGVLAVVFVGLQVWLWTQLWTAGVTLQGGQYATYMYVMTAFHALHVVVGLGLLLWLGLQARHAGQVACAARARLVGIYWHFVGVAWLLLFVLLFVV